MRKGHVCLVIHEHSYTGAFLMDFENLLLQYVLFEELNT